MEYLDAFTASWQSENNWLFYLPYLIPKVLKHLEFSKATGTLVAPMWTSAIWWLLLTYDGKTFGHKVIEYFVVEPMENNFISAAPGFPLFGSNATNFVILLLRLPFEKKDLIWTKTSSNSLYVS